MFGLFTRRVIDFVRREDGPTAAEYAVMLALIVTVIIAVSSIGNTTSAAYSDTKLQKAVGS